MRRLSEIVLRAFVLAVVTAAFFGVPYCRWGVKAQGLLWGGLATLLLGRFFCRSACPLGILQSLVNALCHPRAHVRRVCTRLPQSTAQKAVRWGIVGLCAVLGACGFMGLVTCVLPISIFGKAVAALRGFAETASLEPAFDTPEARVFAIFSVAALAFVLALAACGRGRVWCNWICPFGTLYSLIARFSPVKDRTGTQCRHCGKCFGPAGESNESNDRAVKQSPSAVDRRGALKGVALLAVTEKLTDGGLAGVSPVGVPARQVPVLPPGAGSSRAFRLKCVACQLCVANCPGGCLKPSLRLATFGQPEMDFRAGGCIATCVRCGEVCPEGAILNLRDIPRRDVHAGFAVWTRDLCIRTTEKTACTACERKCPVRAIHIVRGIPVVDRDACIGCGACEHVCPARPQPAIRVEGFEEQRIVRPMPAAGGVSRQGDSKETMK